ncbi:MAG: ABC transporter permease [Myxococcota bacterium]|jgi:phospholipid/cholesterol/gamma-HCH transport system permease protein|nr:ABC transporter permease [Myxococcota bacterium]
MASKTAQDVSSEPRGFELLLAYVGEPLVLAFLELRGIAQTAALTVAYAIRGQRRREETWSQALRIGNHSLLFVAAVAASLGTTLVYQAGLQAQRILGDLTLLGPLYLQLLLREFGPTITALMLATRVGTGISAEIGSMVVTEQVDALRMSGVHPVEYLIVPRFWASTVMMLCLVCFSVLVSWVAGMLTAQLAFGVSPLTFAKLTFIIPGDVVLMLLKSLVYGMTIPIVAGASGLAAHGGSEGVGWATTQSVVNCSLIILFEDFLLSGFGYLFLLR